VFFVLISTVLVNIYYAVCHRKTSSYNTTYTIFYYTQISLWKLIHNLQSKTIARVSRKSVNNNKKWCYYYPVIIIYYISVFIWYYIYTVLKFYLTSQNTFLYVVEPEHLHLAIYSMGTAGSMAHA
jgi:hypothetical protein